ncbi:TPA: hypothetical protein DEP58_04515 [Patescibacteria group bacterium]|nr:MAG: hypothetical protein UU98_C0003G0013 [Parcubacteria group bacterium GW2011_GWD2_42_14]HCC05532.1 hypothetical protein [Patescibacteria group bacterium]
MKESYQKFIERITHLFVQKSIQSAPHKVTKSWFINIVFSVCVAVLLCGVGIYVLFFSKNEEIIQQNTATSTKSFLSDARLDVVVEHFRNQTILFNEMRSNVPDVPITGMSETAEISSEIEETSKEEGGVQESQEPPVPQM